MLCNAPVATNLLMNWIAIAATVANRFAHTWGFGTIMAEYFCVLSLQGPFLCFRCGSRASLALAPKFVGLWVFCFSLLTSFMPCTSLTFCLSKPSP